MCLESVEHGVCSSSIEGKRCKYGYHLKGAKATQKPNDSPSENKMKDKSKPDSKPSRRSAPEVETAGEDDESEDDSTKEIMKHFLVSVVNLVSGLMRDKKAKVKKKKDQNSDLLKSLANLLN